MTRKTLGFLIDACLGLLMEPARVAAQLKAYVTNEGSNDVSVIDTNMNTVVKTLGVGLGPRPVAISPDGRFVYVANHGERPNNTVSVIDRGGDAVLATITVGVGPTRIGFSIDSACAYAVNEGSNDITVIDTGSMTVVTTVGAGSQPRPGERRLGVRLDR